MGHDSDVAGGARQAKRAPSGRFHGAAHEEAVVLRCYTITLVYPADAIPPEPLRQRLYVLALGRGVEDA